MAYERDDIVSQARKCLEDAKSAEAEWRQDAEEDLDFRVGEQWPEKTRNERTLNSQPCLTFNLVPKFVRQVTGDARQNKPSITVHGVDSKSDPETAEILKDAIRGIEYESRADAVYISGLEQAVLTGIGYWRVNTNYSDEESFDQQISIVGVEDQFAVYFDPNSQRLDKSDAMWCLVTNWMDKQAFKYQYGAKAEDGEPWALDSTEGDKWMTEDTVCVAEYWYKEPATRVLQVLSYPVAGTGGVDQMGQPIPPQMDEITRFEDSDTPVPQGAQVVQERKVKTYKIKQYVITGNQVIETNEWPGRYIPIVPCVGELVIVNGKRYYHGIVRFMKDPQRFWNYWLTKLTEQVALAPTSPWMVTPKMIEQHKADWDNASSANLPYLQFDPDPEVPGVKPDRQLPPQIGTGYGQLLQIAQQGLNDTSGIYQPSLGAQSNESSGRAILARQREGDTGTYVYLDNYNFAIEYTGRIILDLIPHIYDTPRELRTITDDENVQLIPINQLLNVEGVAKVYDLTAGKYDARVTSGPNYATRRIEVVNSMLEFMRIVPAAAPLLADVLAKNMDWPDADKVSERLAMMVPQPPPQQIPGAGGPPGIAPGPGVIEPQPGPGTPIM